MTQTRIINEYFEWLYGIVCGDRFSKRTSFRKLLMYLHSIEFTYIIPNDENRAGDGIELRRRFSYDYTNSDEAEEYLDGPCSVLEMMVALAIRCEESIMDDPSLGNRTGQWFWGMIKNLGLFGMIDEYFDKEIVDTVIQTLLNREYKPNGENGLFTIRRCREDLRKVEIWHQLCWYLDTIT